MGGRGYWWKSQKEQDHWEDLDARGMDNIKMDLREIGWVGMNWTDLALDREHWRALVNTVMNLGKFLSNCTTYGFSRRAQLYEVSYCQVSGVP
jgi:hypothetical protein